ncbi:unnamed protein product [Miscanthus lutarioriparius]|uniref:Uncharacterized protein n=1 Tax=Miscanthus lutarioriparius TaxID=422564 RepID=A0A811NMU7_9POAL|nr:unnamed protein product [Miscanthus lutarioriparius]
MAVDALDVPPLAIIPPTRKVSKARGGLVDLHPCLATATLSLHPAQSVSEKDPDQGPTKGVEIPDCLPRNKDRGEFQMVLIIESGDVSSAEYSMSSTPSTPMILKTHKLVGGGPRKGKVFVPPTPPDERRVTWESLDSVSSPKTIRRTSNPLSINGSQGCFEGEEPNEKTDYERLLGVVARLKNNNIALQELVAELKTANFDLEENFCSLRLSTNAKLAHIAKAIGKEDILTPPSP